MNISQTLVLALASALLAGCAAKVTASSPRTVMINAGDGNADGAMKLASVECAKYDRHARLAAMPTEANMRRWVFDCVQ